MMKRLILLLVLHLCIIRALTAQVTDSVIVRNIKNINSSELDFSPAFYGKGIIFVSNRPAKNNIKIFDKKINKATTSLFYSKIKLKGTFQTPQLLSKQLLSVVHDGPVTFDKTTNCIIFSRNTSLENGKKAKYTKGVSYQKLYKSHLTYAGWSVPEELNINEENSDACHPTITSDGERLYFASNRAGGFGGMDLYLSKKIGGTWGKPINLGIKINTEKNEVFPFIHDDGKLYFSSDNTGGEELGDLDIYYASPDIKEGFKSPEPLNPPFNSEKDDFGFIINPENKEGFFSSNRDGGVGNDDIYGFELLDNVKPFSDVKSLSDNYKDTKGNKNERIVTVFVIDRKTSSPLSNVFLCKASTGTQLPTAQTAGENCETTITDTTGKAVIHMVLNDNYFIRIIKPEYKPVQLSIMKDDNRDNFIILMDTIQDDTEEPKTVKTENPSRSDERIFYLRNVYYDYDDYAIRWDARETLDTLVKILQNFPDMEVEIAAHTDSRGNMPYNLNLSKKRANSVIDYLTDRGITRSRLKPVGYGELQPVNSCGDGVPCPPEMHQLNRRTEVRIIKSGSALGRVFPQNSSNRN